MCSCTLLWKWNLRSCGFIERKCDITLLNKLTFKKWNVRENCISNLFSLLEKFLQEPAFVGKSIVRNTAFFKQMQTFSGEQSIEIYMQFIFFFSIRFFQYFAIKQLPTVWTPIPKATPWQQTTTPQPGNFSHGHTYVT